MKITELKKNKPYRRPFYRKDEYIIFIDEDCYFSWKDGKREARVTHRFSYDDIQATDYELVKIHDTVADIKEN